MKNTEEDKDKLLKLVQKIPLFLKGASLLFIAAIVVWGFYKILRSFF